MNNITQSIKVLALALVLSVGISYVSAWTVPTDTPPSSNASAPINVSSTAQVKAGSLGVSGLFRGYGNVIVDGNVGIGTTNPTQKFDVAGSANISGVLSLGKVQIIDVVTENTACSPNGLVARDSTGLLLFCQSGVWKNVTGAVGLISTNYADVYGSMYTSKDQYGKYMYIDPIGKLYEYNPGPFGGYTYICTISSGMASCGDPVNSKEYQVSLEGIRIRVAYTCGGDYDSDFQWCPSKGVNCGTNKSISWSVGGSC